MQRRRATTPAPLAATRTLLLSAAAHRTLARMARSLAVALAAAALFLAVRADAKDIIVGGEKGWTEGARAHARIG
jgi:hypothetical protein